LEQRQTSETARSVSFGDDLHERFIARQPIFDQHLRVFAYELLFRAGPRNCFEPREEASSRVIVESTMVFDFDSLVGSAKAFVNVSEKALLRGAARLLPSSKIVVELLEGIEPSDDVIRSCTELCRDGYVLALDDFVDDPKWEPLIQLAKILKIDFRTLDPKARRSIARRHLPGGLKLLAEKVETQAEVQEAQDLGYTYFQGFFFCKPLMVAGREIPASKLTCVRLLRAIAVSEISFSEIEMLLKQEPALVYKLLRYLNSPLLGLRNEIHGVRDAVVFLGEIALRRWISIVALVSMADDKPPELIHTALLRAHFCEEISHHLDTGRQRSDFFLMGLLSVLDALLDQPMDAVLEHVAVSEDIRHALCGGRNRFRDVYDAVIAYERADWEALESVAARVGICEEQMPDYFARAAEQARLVWR
jgi:c-di-GMP-related signal transduction protein